MNELFDDKLQAAFTAIRLETEAAIKIHQAREKHFYD